MLSRILARRLALRLALAVAPITLVACGGGSDDEAGDSAVAEEVAAEDTASEQAAPEPEPTPAPDTSDYINQRPTQVELTITGDRSWAGSYRASDKSRDCGRYDPMVRPGKPHNFHVGFPYENADQISDVTFVADSLPVGGSTTSFHLSVAPRSPSIGAPPNLVFRANDPKSGETGTATLVQRGDTAVLQVTAKDERSGLTMTVRCARRVR